MVDSADHGIVVDSAAAAAEARWHTWSFPLLALTAIIAFGTVGVIAEALSWPWQLVAVLGAGPTLVLWLLVGIMVRGSGLAAGLFVLVLAAIGGLVLFSYFFARITMADTGSAIQQLLCNILGVHDSGRCR